MPQHFPTTLSCLLRLTVIVLFSAPAIAQWDVELVSGAPPSTSAGGESHAVGMGSTDGRWILFGSRAADLVAGVDDDNGEEDVFLHDRVLASTHLVSRSAETGFRTAAGRSWPSAISRNGRWIVFESTARDVDTDFKPGPYHDHGVFLYDRTSGTTHLLSHAPGKRDTPEYVSSGLHVEAVSDDGNSVLLGGKPFGLDPGLQEWHADQVAQYRRDTGITRLITHLAADSTLPSENGGQARGQSGDGRYVLFDSKATDLLAGLVDTNQRSDVFLYDYADGTTRLLSASDTAGQTANKQSTAVSISNDGKRIVFNSCATDLPADAEENFFDDCGGYLFESDSAQLQRLVAFRLRDEVVSLSEDARWMLFVAQDGLQLRDRNSDQTWIVDHVAGLPTQSAGIYRSQMSMSADGRRVLYRSTAEGIVPGMASPPHRPRLYLYSRDTASNRWIAEPEPADLSDAHVSMSADGGWVLFESANDGVVAQDRNVATDVFLHDVGAAATRLVSRRAAHGVATRPGGTSLQIMSDDGRWLVLDISVEQDDGGGLQSQTVLRDVRSHVDVVLGRSSAEEDGDGYAIDVKAISPDGRWLLIESGQPGLVPGVTLPTFSRPVAYIYDRATRRYELLSHADAASGQARPGTALDLSNDGRFVLFSMDVDVEIDGLVRGMPQLFLLDRSDGTRRLVSNAWGEPQTPSDTHIIHRARISADGSWIAFDSDATNLTETPIVGFLRGDVYHVDTTTWTRTILTSPLIGYRQENERVALAGLSDDGTRVLFETNAPAIVPGATDTNDRHDVFLHDAGTGQTQLVSHHEGDVLKASTHGGAQSTLSADGSTVLFASRAFDIDADAGGADPFQFFTYDVSMQRARALPHTRWSPDASHPISADGARIAYPMSSTPHEPSPTLQHGTHLLVHDRNTQAVELVAESSKRPLYTFLSEVIQHVMLSADGRTIGFNSIAPDLAPGVRDGNGMGDAFIATRHDRIYRSGFETH